MRVPTIRKVHKVRIVFNNGTVITKDFFSLEYTELENKITKMKWRCKGMWYVNTDDIMMIDWLGTRRKLVFV